MAVLYTQALADRAQAYLDLPLTEKRSPNGLAALAAIWSAIQQQPAGNCRQCQFSDYNATLIAYLRDFSRLQNPEAMSDSTYQFAPQFADATLTHDSYSKVVTADNLTDEDVKFFTEKGRKDLFVKKGEAHAAPDPTDKGGSTDTKASDALKGEKEAHKAEKKAHAETKKQLSEIEKQLAEAQKQLADIAAKAAADPVVGDVSTEAAK